jgi:hypothetical protein
MLALSRTGGVILRFELAVSYPLLKMREKAAPSRWEQISTKVTDSLKSLVS